MPPESLALLAPLLLTLGACGIDPTAPLAPQVSDGAVTAMRVPEGVRLSNGTDQRLGYVVRNPEWLGLFAPCIDPSPRCLRLAPGSSVVVPLADILGYAPAAREAVVSWWTVTADGAGGYRITEIREIPVPLD